MKENKCPLCGGRIIKSNITFTVDLGSTLVVIRNTPAATCSLCGEEWIDDMVSEEIEEIVNEAKKKKRMIEVVDYALEKAA